MPMASGATEVFEREFLSLRGKLLEVAAALDRIARAEGSVAADPRMAQVRQSLEFLAGADGRQDRVERIQLIFSLPYDPNWRN
ncbi:MAG: hypothetical protein NUV77_23585 [Thermoguttaceae bacterium]|jgi:hypothetical protein|nr:hypothetical protein [Thermoguttaceae bacterium]